jgi:2-hydroxy-6-oxonona-2,4-dienedioate hydrolase
MGVSFSLKEEGFAMEQELITDGDYRYVQSAEEGTPLVLLHGLFGALSNFEDLFAHFAGKMRVIIPMLPLYDMPLATTGAKSLSKHVAGFLDHLGLEKVHLLGNSLGGHVGLIYTKRHPERVASLTLTASSGLYENAFGTSFPRREDKSFIRENDTITPPEVADEFKALLPDADLFWIDHCGHAPMMEHPEPFNHILSDWYERRGILS